MPKRAAHLRFTYGITEDHYDWLLENQDGCCAICKTTKHQCRFDKFYIDHCARTGAVRGLLCMNCNTAIGKLGENPEVMRRAIEYVENAGLSAELQAAGLPEPKAVGQRYKPECHQRKLDWTKVGEIKEAYFNKVKTQGQLAKEYDVTQAMISRIVLGKSWIIEEHGKPINEVVRPPNGKQGRGKKPGSAIAMKGNKHAVGNLGNRTNHPKRSKRF